MIVERRDNETAEGLLNRFRLVVQRSGILRDAKRRRHFTSRSEARRMAHARTMRKLRRSAAKAAARSKQRAPRGRQR
jgi:ribosomal protein S21